VVPASGQGFSGHIRNAIFILLGELSERDGELARPADRRRSRATQATVILTQAGFTDVANPSGGMLPRHADGYAVESDSA
jgi:rhodanese-related sulfurtransferase